jgi:beta-N-acetylhexosaminidase
MSRALRTVGAGAARWLAAGALLWVATHARNPYLLAIRPFETPLVLALAGFGLVWLCRNGSALGPRQAALLAAALSLAIAAMLASEAAFRWQRARVLAGGETLRAAGQHFIVGYTRFDEVAALAERGLIAGVYLGRRNVAGRSAADIRREVDALQALRGRAGSPPTRRAARLPT